MAPKPKTPPPKSPFLAPRRSSSYGGVSVDSGGTPRSSPHTSSILSIEHQHHHEKEVEPEHKSNLIGCTANLITAIVGAGIIGIPYAMRETGLFAGWLLILLSGVLGSKSLCLLVETAKHVDAASYEIMAETVFGKPGWLVCNALMFMMSWGPMLSYLMLVKDTLPKLIGYDPDKCLIVASMCVMLPISLQRDMADLAKTSRLSVLFNIGLVGIVAKFSPTDESMEEAGGFGTILSQSVFRPGTCFIGLGIISFAFSCQHSSMIIAGSLRNPTRERWRSVSIAALAFCSILSIFMGTCGYVGFLEATEGNVLKNFPLPYEVVGNAKELVSARAANIGRGFLCGTMFFVYPLESFVARHVIMTNLFQGREAHEGDDHAVLDRWDRRVATTIALYLSALIPALNYDDVGIVLAWTGTVAATALTYIGPGILFIGVHGQEFLDLVDSAWGTLDDTDDNSGMLKGLLWYLLLMPLWCKVASVGNKGLLYYYAKKEMMTPGPQNRLGKVKHKNLDMLIQQKQRRSQDNIFGDPENITLPTPVEEKTSAELGLITTSNSKDYGSTAPNEINRNDNEPQDVAGNAGPIEEDPQDDKQTVGDFAVAIGFVLFGIVAFTAGVISIYTR